MRFLTLRSSRRACGLWLMLAIGLAALLSGGCLTGPPVPKLDFKEPGWTWEHGQAVWLRKTGGTEIAGDLDIATHTDGRTFLQFTKSPLPIVSAWKLSDRWRVQFGPQGFTLGGNGTPPARWGWVHLAGVLHGAPAPEGWTWEKLPGGRWRFQHPATGETMEGWLGQ